MTIENEKMIASSSSENYDISLGKKNSNQLPPQNNPPWLDERGMYTH